VNSSNILLRQCFNVESEYQDEVMEGAEEKEEVWSRCACSMHSRSLKDFPGTTPGSAQTKKRCGDQQAKEAAEDEH